MRAIGREIRSGDIVVMMGMLDDATGTVSPAAGIEVAAMLFCTAVVMGAAGGTVSPGQNEWIPFSTRWNIHAHSSH
jgi:hypothetical protein